MIEYFRGHITVISRKGLEERSCECYKVIQRENHRLRPQRATLSIGRAAAISCPALSETVMPGSVSCLALERRV